MIDPWILYNRLITDPLRRGDQYPAEIAGYSGLLSSSGDFKASQASAGLEIRLRHYLSDGQPNQPRNGSRNRWPCPKAYGQRCQCRGHHRTRSPTRPLPPARRQSNTSFAFGDGRTKFLITGLARAERQQTDDKTRHDAKRRTRPRGAT